MCLTYFKNKPTSSLSPFNIFCGCGKCEECKQNYIKNWRFRCILEYEYYCLKRGYKLAFITFTYSDFYVPRHNNRYCFDRNMCSHFVRNVRDYFAKKYNLNKESNFRFLWCSELGELHNRPHYHVLFMIPKVIDPYEFYAYLSSHWLYGFISPRTFYGVNGESSFICAVPDKAINYVSKYVSKDFGLSSSLPRSLRPFHLQNKGFGLRLFDVFSDSKKLDYLLNGYPSIILKRRVPLPFDFVRRLLYVPLYLKNGSKRLVRQKNSVFFNAHYDTIFEHKVKRIKERIEKYATEEFYRDNFKDFQFVEHLAQCVVSIYENIAPDFIARWYLVYFNTSLSFYPNVSFSSIWRLKYAENNSLQCYLDCPRFTFQEVQKYNEVTGFIMNIPRLLKTKSPIEQAIKRCSEFWRIH